MCLNVPKLCLVFIFYDLWYKRYIVYIIYISKRIEIIRFVMGEGLVK